MPVHANLDRLALILIDVQRGFDDAAYWGPRNNPDCEPNIAALLETWRAHSRPVVFVRHDSPQRRSPLRLGQPGNDFKRLIRGQPDLLVSKSVNSAFHGAPDLDAWLRAEHLSGLVVVGITTNLCCETTARVRANLGYQIVFALDATHTFDRRAPDGRVVPAAELARITATNLHDEFATVVSTPELLDQTQARADAEHRLDVSRPAAT